MFKRTAGPGSTVGADKGYEPHKDDDRTQGSSDTTALKVKMQLFFIRPVC